MNIYALTSAERNSRKKYRCNHRHNGLDHPSCYNEAYGINERIAFVDIESSQLNASFGIILSYCLLGDDKTLFKRCISPEELRGGLFDKPLCEQFCKDVLNFDRLMGWYSEKFDMPFLRTRCLYWGLDFPKLHQIKHTDLWRVSRNKLKMHSNRLGAVAPFFGIAAKEHPLNPNIWIRCLSGDQKALDFVLTHNIEDVHSTREIYHKLEDHMKLQKASI